MGNHQVSQSNTFLRRTAFSLTSRVACLRAPHRRRDGGRPPARHPHAEARATRGRHPEGARREEGQFPLSTAVSSSYSPGTWYHLAMTRDGATVRFYVDGRFGSTLAVILVLTS